MRIARLVKSGGWVANRARRIARAWSWEHRTVLQAHPVIHYMDVGLAASYGRRDAYWISWGEGMCASPATTESACASESGAAHRSAINSKSSMLGPGLSTSTAVAVYSLSRATSCSTAYCCSLRRYSYGSASAA